MNDISLLHIALIYLAVIRSSFARLLPKGRKNVVTFFVYGINTEECKVAILNAFPIFLFDYFGRKIVSGKEESC